MSSPAPAVDEPGATPRDFTRRAFTVGVSGPVGSGKTTLLVQLCRALHRDLSLGVVTNEVRTSVDFTRLAREAALAPARLRAVQTGSVGSSPEANLLAMEDLMRAVQPELLLVEQLGGGLDALGSPELIDFELFVLDAAAGTQTVEKGGRGLAQAALLVLNKADLAASAGVELEALAAGARRLRAERPVVVAQLSTGRGVEAICAALLSAWQAALTDSAQRLESRR